MGPSGKCILGFHRTFRWLPSSAEHQARSGNARLVRNDHRRSMHARANWKTRNSFDRRVSAASGQKLPPLCCVCHRRGPAQLKVALDISALPLSLFEIQANLKARKIQGSMSLETSLNVSGLTCPRGCNGSRPARFLRKHAQGPLSDFAAGHPASTNGCLFH